MFACIAIIEHVEHVIEARECFQRFQLIGEVYIYVVLSGLSRLVKDPQLLAHDLGVWLASCGWDQCLCANKPVESTVWLQLEQIAVSEA